MSKHQPFCLADTLFDLQHQLHHSTQKHQLRYLQGGALLTLYSKQLCVVYIMHSKGTVCERH